MSRRSRHITAGEVHFARATYDSAAKEATDIVCEIDMQGETPDGSTMELRIRITDGPARRHGNEEMFSMDLRAVDFVRLREVLSAAIEEAQRVGILPR